MFVKLTARARQMVAPPNPTRSGYLPGLDGLRALAILAVLVYHADLVWLPGGFLGVEVFFVVSGYLITLLLRNEYRKHGAIRFGNFWRRRARRLLPALFVMLAAVLVWMVAFLPDEVATIRGDVRSGDDSRRCGRGIDLYHKLVFDCGAKKLF
ncbi:acyltransferase [Anaerolineae bacterium CFX7]|nr:acyltransferase [Anaerolineae bacterium CFX7]